MRKNNNRDISPFIAFFCCSHDATWERQRDIEDIDREIEKSGVFLFSFVRERGRDRGREEGEREREFVKRQKKKSFPLSTIEILSLLGIAPSSLFSFSSSSMYAAPPPPAWGSGDGGGNGASYAMEQPPYGGGAAGAGGLMEDDEGAELERQLAIALDDAAANVVES